MRANPRILGALILVSALPARAGDVTSLDAWLALEPEERPELASLDFAQNPLTRSESEAALRKLWEDARLHAEPDLGNEWEKKIVRAGGREMKFEYRTYGEKPAAGWDLYISLHGGGNAPQEVNESQWKNQIELYQPEHALYVAPRAPTDTWNLWHEAHIDALIDRLIEAAVVHGNANPDRVYLMGYSAGGDGVYQLAPRMADRFAAAAMMAGHPNESSPMGLRNIGFAIHVGADDDGYDRNGKAKEWETLLSRLHGEDPNGYRYEVELHKGRGHWMELEDRSALEWMARFTRNPYPDRVVWRQDDVMHSQFYWLAVPGSGMKAYSEVIAEREGQTIRISHADGLDSVTILLNDRMLDLDLPVEVFINDESVFRGTVPRTLLTLQQTMRSSSYPGISFCAEIPVKLIQPVQDPPAPVPAATSSG